MKANELRIGNYILHEPTIDDWEEIIVTLPSLLQVDISPESYCGIPLTEEWLLKFGFEKLEHDMASHQYLLNGFPEVIIYGDAVPYTVINENMIDLLFVHSLQNLYFALTGEELQIKK